MRNAPGYPVSSVDNVLTLLKLLRDEGELRVADAASYLGVSHSTAHRLLSMLRYHEFATQDGRRVYRAGPAITGPYGAAPLPDLKTTIHPHLRALARDLGDTVHLVTLEGDGARFIDGVDGSHALRVGTRIGMLMPAHVTSGGKVLLAELPRDDLNKLYSRGLPRVENARITDMAGLLRELATVRRRGYATNLEESERGITAVAVALRDSTGRPVAALALAGPTMRFPRRRFPELAERLHATAKAVGADL
jgi:DNA-binding IclR family transcriptional regulator